MEYNFETQENEESYTATDKLIFNNIRSLQTLFFLHATPRESMSSC